jgi:hypothetical protein
MKTLLASTLVGLTLIGTTVAAGPASASITCTTVRQYQVTAFGDLTSAQSGGSVVGYGYAGDIFNVRQLGSPRYYGAIAATGTFGWFLSSKLSYIGDRCI